MRLRLLLATTALAAVAGPALAGDIHPVVNVSTDLANDFRGLTFAADGDIYTSGHVGTVNEEFRTIAARFNADGTLDTGFGEDGVVDVDVAVGRQEQSLGVVELEDGDVIVAVNAVDEDGGTSIYLLRFDSTGAQEVGPAWGDDTGKVEVVLGWANADNDAYPGVELPPVDTSWDLLVDNSGAEQKLVVFALGSAANGTTRTDVDRYVTRLLASDGSIDPSFNGGVPFAYHSTGTFGDQARRGLVEADGSILASGYTNLGAGLANHVILIRLLPDGSLDTSFGGFIEPASSGTAVGLAPVPGVAVFNPLVVDGGFAETYGVARQSSGAYVTTGYGGATATGQPSTLGFQTTAAPDLVTFRINGSTFDTTWGTDGREVIQSEGQGQPTAEERGRAIVGLPDDRVIEVGRYGGNAAAYVFTADGQLDESQDGHGVIVLGHPAIGAQFFNAKVSADGTHVAMTTNADPRGARLVILQVGE